MPTLRTLVRPIRRHGPPVGGKWHQLAPRLRKLAESSLDFDALTSAVNALLDVCGEDPLPDDTTPENLADRILRVAAAIDAEDVADPMMPDVVAPLDSEADPTAMSRPTFCPRCLQREDERVEMHRLDRGGKTLVSCPRCKHEIESTAPAKSAARQSLAVQSEPFRRRTAARSARQSDSAIAAQLKQRGIKPSWK